MISLKVRYNDQRVLMFENQDILIDYDTKICIGDLYVAERNTGLKLLTCKHNYGGFIISVEKEYIFDINECAKLIDLL